MAEADRTLHPEVREMTTYTGVSMLMAPCPASIWLLGAAAMCGKGLGHDGMHEVKIQWTIQ